MPKKNKSNFKNLSGAGVKPDKQYLDIPAPYTTGEGNYIAASGKYIAYAGTGGGGAIHYEEHKNTGRSQFKRRIAMHKGKATDLDFNPFIDSMLATCSDDCTVNVVSIGDDEKEPATKRCTMNHDKKVVLVRWHPTANGVLASTSWDKTVKVWDIGTEANIGTIDLKEKPFSMEWNSNGSMLAFTDKAKTLTLQDPREESASCTVEDFTASQKTSKVFWAENQNMIGCTLFNKQAKRALKIWDLRKLKEDDPVFYSVLDTASSVAMPYYDEPTSCLYLAGKGDGSVSLKNLAMDGKYVWDATVFATNEPQKGGCFLPKRLMDIEKKEITRFLKLTGKGILPVSFTLLRKGGGFDKDLWPDCFMGLPSVTSEQYAKKEGDLTKLISTMDPDKREDAPKVEIEAKKTYGELLAENEDLKKKIAELEAKLKEE